MRRILVIVYSAFIFILLVNIVYYKSLYKNQINYIVELLDRQVQIIGISVDNINNGFISDLNRIGFSEDLPMFFTDPDNQYRARESMRLFFSKYNEFITSIKLYDNNKNEFTLKKDTDTETEAWLEQTFLLHVQPEIFLIEKLVEVSRQSNYYLPVINKRTNEVIGNIVVAVDYQKYFNEIFSAFNLKDYQWQWVISNSGDIIYDNSGSKISYSQLDKIILDLEDRSIENKIHNALIDGENTEILSSYYSTQLLEKEIGIVFSATTVFFQKFIIRNSLFIVISTMLIILVIIFVFWKYLRAQQSEIDRMNTSEKMLVKLIDEMPVGVLIHNSNREIIKANKVAASQYSYSSESEMKGKIFPESSFKDNSDYFSKNLGGSFNPDQFVIIKKEIGEIVLYRNSIPVIFMGEDSTMEILIDVTMLESARKQEVRANVAKSEFLARMSYEIRTPLNGIIGMTDVLNRHNLSPGIREIVGLLNSSTEVLLNIINDILDFSRIEAGKMILEEIPYNIREEITYSTDLARTSILQSDVKLICTIDDNIPESIIGDPFRLRQVLTNLINNAIKNTENGEIRLNCGLKSNKNGIIILGFELLDSGLSFDKVTLKKMFGDFVDFESNAMRINEDTRFGPILSKQLIELMGGELLAESPSGLLNDRGVKVSFTVKTFSNDKLIKELQYDKFTKFEQIKTLVITGNQSRDEELLGAFHRLGLRVSITTFQKTTVNQIKANLSNNVESYNLVIIIEDKDFNGFDAARAIWENNLSGCFIILLISSNDKKGNYMNCIMLGIDHYLVKPFDIRELVNTFKDSFPFLENPSESVDIGSVRDDIKILVVDDNKMNQKVIGTMLKSLGYSFNLANDGYDGYLQAKIRKFDIIFMDLIMPEMDGFESSQKILDYDNSILIVAFTADNMPETKKKAELSGIKDFISKPVKIDDLKRLFAKYFLKESLN